MWGNKTLWKWNVEQQFVFAIDIKRNKTFETLVYLPITLSLFLFMAQACTVIIFQKQMKALTEEPNPPISYTMNKLHGEVEQTVIRRFFAQQMKESLHGGLILISHPVCFRVIFWPNPRFVLSQPSDCCSITNTHIAREGGEGWGMSILKSIPQPFWSCLAAAGEESHGKRLFFPSWGAL